MDDIDIQKQIEELTAQAAERKIYEKAVHAAYHLGKGRRDLLRHSGDRETRVIHDDPDAGAGLMIDFSRTVHHDGSRSTYETLEILEGEETVFLQKGGTVEGYIPGDWEAELDRLQRPADRAKEDTVRVAEQEKQAADSERAVALRKAWGLSATDGRTRGADEPKPRTGGVVERPPRRRR